MPFEKVVTGRGAFARLPAEVDRLGKRRAFILTGRGPATETDWVERAERLLGGRWAGTELDCSSPASGRGAEAAARAGAAGADLLVSFGEGSAIDAGRRVALDLLRIRREPEPPQIAIPTTLSAGFLAPLNGARKPGGAPPGVPRVVLLDPEVTTATSPRLWSATGIEALDQAVECLWSPRAQPLTDTLAVDAIRRLDRDLRASLEPAALEARLQCQIAAWTSLFGILEVGARLSRPLGRQISAHWDVPHGIASGIALPTVMRFLLPRTRAAQARVAAALGIAAAGQSRGQRAALAADGVEALIRTLGLPRRLSEVGADRAELNEVARAVSLELWRLGSPDAERATEAVLRSLLEEMG
jgi:alcohol dehydrogenase